MLVDFVQENVSLASGLVHNKSRFIRLTAALDAMSPEGAEQGIFNSPGGALLLREPATLNGNALISSSAKITCRVTNEAVTSVL